MSAMFIQNSLSPRVAVKKYIIQNKLLNYQCEICKNNGIWQGKHLRLHLDHINGIRNDHRLENLRFLCPNCHDQQETSHSKKGENRNKWNKLSVEKILEARKTSKNIRDILLKLNVSDSSTNYRKIKNVLLTFKQEFPLVVKIVGSKKNDRPHLRKVLRPEKNILQKLITELPMTKIAKFYGVTDNAIRKWATRYGIDYRTCSPTCLRNKQG